MTRESFVFLLGFIIFFVPFLGLPATYKEYLLIGVGILLMLVGYSLRRSSFLRSIEREGGERHADAFVEGRRTTPAQHKDSVHEFDS